MICQCAAMKYNSCLSELKLHLPVGIRWLAQCCSAPSCGFQTGKEYTSWYSKEMCSENVIKWNHRDFKWLKSVSDPILIYNCHLSPPPPHKPTLFAGNMWDWWQVKLAKWPLNPFMCPTGTMRDTDRQATVTTWVSRNLGSLNQTVHSFLQRKKITGIIWQT